MTRDQLACALRWSAQYCSAWDSDPWRYLEAGVLPPGRSRRLGMVAEAATGFKAYLGVQHYDPGLWGYPGAAYCRFFLSLFTGAACQELRTYATLEEALDRLWTFYETVASTPLHLS